MSTLEITPPDAATIRGYANVHYSPQTYTLEKQIAERFRETHGGLLPTGSAELGGKFWDYMRYREQIAAASGHEARFDFYHPCVSKWLAEDSYLRNLVPVSPPVSPPVTLPQPCPPLPVCPLPVGPPVVIQPPPGGELPGPPSAVPEPSSAWMFAIGLILVCLGARAGTFVRVLRSWKSERVSHRRYQSTTAS